MAELPLRGLRILEASLAWAIPFATKILADMGAEVIKVESCTRLDSTRGHGPYPDNKPGERHWDQTGLFNASNPNKLGITVDFSTPKGKRIFKELAKISDVVTENFTPRVFKGLGFGYEALKEIKPDVILVSSTGFGHTGPWQNYGALGWGLGPMTGLSHLTGYEDGPPLRSRTAYPDLMGALNTSWAILAAVEYRRRTGKGQWIDVSQYEIGTSVVGDAILDYTVNGRVQTRMGNRHSSMAPHGCYRCKGSDKWVVIAVASDDEWQRLCGAMGNPAWTGESRFATTLERWRNQDELDRLVAEWTTSREHYEVMQLLQQAGVRAGAVLNDKELLLDPHMRERDYFQLATHPDPTVGTRPHMGPWFKLSETPGEIRMAAPTLGQHNEDVLVGLLGMAREEVAELESDGIIGTWPGGSGTAIGRGADSAPVAVPLPKQIEQGTIEEYDEDYKDVLGLRALLRRDA